MKSSSRMCNILTYGIRFDKLYVNNVLLIVIIIIIIGGTRYVVLRLSL